MIEWIHPALFFFLCAAIIPFVKGKARPLVLLGLPALAFISLMIFPEGNYGAFTIGGFEVVFGRVDRLSRVFGYVFTLMGVIGMVYALHVKQNGQHMAALIYGGGALGSVFAGDLLTLFVFWEVMAFSSVFLVWYGGEKSASPGTRYLLVHTFGGLCLLAGILFYASETGSFAFNEIPAAGLGGWLILLGFLVNAGAPPLHAWLPDAYPEGSITGTIFLSSFTTKTAVYVLARGFAGTEFLIWVGIIMALYGVVYAMLENNIRRLLAYHIISQVGFMVCGIGIGTELAVNGAVAHAFAHILYKALLMMGMGSVIFMTGKRKGTELGGLYKTMPLTFILFMIGGFSISGVPFLSGFISKSMVISGAAAAHNPYAALLLTLAASGTFLSTTLKLPYAVFLGKDKGIKASDPPKNMIIGMVLAAFVCILLGVMPGLLYHQLPFPVDYHPYTAEHLAGAFQILLATLIGFLLFLYKLHPEDSISVDTDWSYRKAAPGFLWLAHKPIAKYEGFITEVYKLIIIRATIRWVAICRIFDTKIIDGIVNNIGKVVFSGGWLSSAIEKYVIYGFLNLVRYVGHVAARILRRLQTGTVNHYAMIIIVGIFILVNLYLILKPELQSMVVVK